MSADAVTLELSRESKKEMPPVFTDKQFLYVNDQNNGSYSGQIVLNTTSLSNNGAYVDYKEAYLVIPTVLQITSPTLTVASVPLDFSVCLKAGYWNLLHSMSIELNGSSVQQQTGFMNLYTSFKNLTTWSEDDIKCWGKVTGFCPDTADSWVYNTAVASATNVLAGNGTGLSNNRTSFAVPINGIGSYNAGLDCIGYTSNVILGTESTSSSDSVYACVNQGMMQRMKWLNFQVDATSSLTGSISANKVALLGYDASRTRSLFKGYVASTATSRAIVFPAIVRLKDVSDLFSKLPMMKGASFTFYINTNQCLCKFSQAAVGVTAAGIFTSHGSLQLTEPPTMLGGGGTCPIMLASASAGQGLSNAVAIGLAAPVGAVAGQVAVSIVKTQFPSITPEVSAPITSVRLYAPCYTMTAQNEQAYLADAEKVISYEDIFQYQFNNTVGSFNFLVSNGLPGLKSVVVMPFLPQASNGTVGGAGIYAGGALSSSLLSPFSSSGGTPDPVALTNLNCQISGRNLLNDNEQYDFQAFTQQLALSNQLNGGITTGLTSGLIGLDEFDNLYRYYYFDASRGRPGEAGVPRSIQILGEVVNSATFGVNLFVFATFTRNIKINVGTGARVEM
jgi:hypothetical protein